MTHVHFKLSIDVATSKWFFRYSEKEWGGMICIKCTDIYMYIHQAGVVQCHRVEDKSNVQYFPFNARISIFQKC